ncbi:MAG: type 1 glutamine amidotransferase domain-containing protein [Spirosomataceae bacterium]
MSRKILIVATSVKEIPERKLPTGVWLSTLARFIRVVEHFNYDYTIMSPSGGEVKIDPLSLKWLFTKKGDWQYFRNPAFNQRLQHTPSPREINPNDYDAIYFAGGFGSLTDFPENEFLQDYTRQIYENGGIVSGIGHGIAGLMNVVLKDGHYLVDNKQVTAFSNFEELLKGTKKIVPFSVEDELKKRGAIYKKAVLPFALFMVSDRQVITGQSPCAAGSIAKEIVRLLHNVKDSIKDVSSVLIQDNSMSLKPGC